MSDRIVLTKLKKAKRSTRAKVIFSRRKGRTVATAAGAGTITTAQIKALMNEMC